MIPKNLAPNIVPIRGGTTPGSSRPRTTLGNNNVTSALIKSAPCQGKHLILFFVLLTQQRSQQERKPSCCLTQLPASGTHPNYHPKRYFPASRYDGQACTRWTRPDGTEGNSRVVQRCQGGHSAQGPAAVAVFRCQWVPRENKLREGREWGQVGNLFSKDSTKHHTRGEWVSNQYLVALQCVLPDVARRIQVFLQATIRTSGSCRQSLVWSVRLEREHKCT